MKKPNFYGSRESFDAAATHDGFFLEGEPGSFTLHARIAGQPSRLEKGVRTIYSYFDGTVTLEVKDGLAIGLAASSEKPAGTHRIDMGRFHTLAALLTGITSPARVHQINTRLLASSL